MYKIKNIPTFHCRTRVEKEKLGNRDLILTAKPLL